MIRHLMRRPPSLWFILAGALAVAAALATTRAAATKAATTSVLVAATNLTYGSNIAARESATREVAVPVDGVLPGMLRRRDEIGGRILVVPLTEGEPITQASLGGSPDVAPPPLRVGERAISVPRVAAGAAAAALVPGARVDVIASRDNDSAARVVVSGAEVIAQTLPDGESSEGGAVLLRVSARKALELSAALDSTSGVRLLPRPVDDDEEIAP